MGKTLVQCSEENRIYLKKEAGLRGMHMTRLLDEIINASRKAMPKGIPQARVTATDSEPSSLSK
jgi:hypothetical protein